MLADGLSQMNECMNVKVLESCSHEDFDPRKKLDSLMHLAELCVEVIQQNEEYHAEVSQSVSLSICPQALVQSSVYPQSADEFSRLFA